MQFIKSALVVIALMATPIVAKAQAPSEAACLEASKVIYSVAKVAESGMPPELAYALLTSPGSSVPPGLATQIVMFVYSKANQSPEEITNEFLQNCLSQPA